MKNIMIEIAKKFGTPVYLLYEDEIIRSCSLFKRILNENFGNKAMPLYACKALSCKYLCRLLKEQGFGLDVSSGGELFTSQASDFPISKVMFHGNNKTKDEIEYAIDLGIYRIVVDNCYELENIMSISEKKRKNVKILVRVRPEIEAFTHKSIQTGGKNSKFGMSFDELTSVINKIKNHSYVELKGLHAHIGSQIFDIKSFEELSEVMIKLYISLIEKFGLNLEDLNLGGGFGVRYLNEGKKLDLQRCISKVSYIIKKRCQEHDVEIPFMYFEPGRSIVAKAGVTLYTVGCVKENDESIHVIVDGSMNDNPRFVLYGAKCLVEDVSKKGIDSDYRMVCVSGRCCESVDIISSNCLIKNPEVGDILAVYCTGAYNFSMSLNYNKFCKPPIILLKNDGTYEEIVRRQTYDDLISCEV